MCIYRCDTSPCVSIATSALRSAPSHAPPVGAGRGYRSRGLWARPRLRVARGALTGARLPPNGTTTIPRWSGRSSSSPGIGRICTSISSARSPGTRPCECSSIGASENGGCAPDPRRLNGARVIDGAPYDRRAAARDGLGRRAPGCPGNSSRLDPLADTESFRPRAPSVLGLIDLGYGALFAAAGWGAETWR